MVDARSVSDNQGRTFISFCFCDCFQGLSFVCAHSDLCYINIAVAHSHHAQVFFLGLFAACCEFSDCCSRGGFRGLTAGVGVNFGIEYHYVYVFAGSEYMVKTAVTDIISPTVATEDPMATFYEELFFCVKSCAFIALFFIFFQNCNESICTFTSACAYVHVF